jgi:CRISPR/Cas system-associated exonuclease Cas4 (RecB family)
VIDVAAALLLAVLVVVAALHVRSRRRAPGGDEPWLPLELRGAELAYAEQRFESQRHGLVARLDRAYRLGGTLYLVELKTRGRHEARVSDVMELSAQRIVLQERTGEAVSKAAYVAVQKDGQGAPRPVRVRLFGEAQVLAMRRRLLEVRASCGHAPEPARSAAACRKCGHREACQRTFGDRG